MPISPFAPQRVIDDDQYEIAVFVPGSSKKGPDAPSLTVSTRLNSSIFSQDPIIHDFLSSRGTNELAKKTLNSLLEAKKPELVRFFPLLFMQLLETMARDKSVNIQQLAFRALVELIKLYISSFLFSDFYLTFTLTFRPKQLALVERIHFLICFPDFVPGVPP